VMKSPTSRLSAAAKTSASMHRHSVSILSTGCFYFT
jgi:hypothetical protein